MHIAQLMERIQNTRKTTMSINEKHDVSALNRGDIVTKICEHCIVRERIVSVLLCHCQHITFAYHLKV